MNEEFRNIFNELIGKYLNNTLIYKYDSLTKNHSYTPFSHDIAINTEVKLAEFMRKYIYFYAYSEREVIQAHSKNRLDNLELASQRALRERLPNRRGSTNGLYSELLLDLLINLYFDSNKLATRTIYRQSTDNQEIKGFDGLHFFVEGDRKEIWLGQAKMGGEKYCISDILSDLNDKANILYSSEQLYFVSDKENTALEPALQLLNNINNISWNTEGLSAEDRATHLEQYFINEGIKLICPCLLAYKSNIYESDEDLKNMIEEQMNNMVEKFDAKFSDLFRTDFEVLIWLFPIRDLNAIRTNMLN